MKLAPTTLVLDCSFAGLSIGVAVKAKVYGREVAEARASDKMLPLLAEVLAEAKIEASQLTDVLVTVGPGSFTGIRLGLAVAEGLKLANPALAIHGIFTLTALAAQVVEIHAPNQPFTILLDAAGGQVYRQDFKADGTATTKPVCEPLATLKSLKKFIAAQTGLLAPFPTHATVGVIAPHILLSLVGQPKLHVLAQPLYLKPLTYKLAK